jgi:hypothetical protein
VLNTRNPHLELIFGTSDRQVKINATINQKLTLIIPPDAHVADCSAAAASNARGRDAVAKRINKGY